MAKELFLAEWQISDFILRNFEKNQARLLQPCVRIFIGLRIAWAESKICQFCEIPRLHPKMGLGTISRREGFNPDVLITSTSLIKDSLD